MAWGFGNRNMLPWDPCSLGLIYNFTFFYPTFILNKFCWKDISILLLLTKFHNNSLQCSKFMTSLMGRIEQTLKNSRHMLVEFFLDEIDRQEAYSSCRDWKEIIFYQCDWKMMKLCQHESRGGFQSHPMWTSKVPKPSHGSLKLRECRQQKMKI